MAENNRDTNNGIVRQLLSRIDELSQAISTNNYSTMAPSQTSQVETEVLRTFTSGNRSQGRSNESPSCSSINQGTTSTSSRFRPYSVQRHFQGQRPLNTSVNRRQAKRKMSNQGDHKPFMIDLILLAGPNDDVVPRQGTRLALNRRGHVILGCQFKRSQSMIDVERTILEAFDGKIPPGVDIELLISIHSSLVVPQLAPGQIGIDGAMLQRLYRSKPVYVRPNKQLIEEEKTQQSGLQNEDYSDMWEDDDFWDDNDTMDLPVSNTTSTVPGHTHIESPPVQEEAPPLVNAHEHLVVETEPSLDDIGCNDVAEHTNFEFASSDPLSSSLEPNAAQQADDEIVVLTDNDDDNLQLISMLGYDIPRNATVHRTTIQKDMIELFSDAYILNYVLDMVVINVHGQPEKGKGKGVVLDVLTHFWHDFFIAFAYGRKAKVPLIRHDMQKKEWEAVARILVYGYKQFGYFPIDISCLFIASCLFGEESINLEFLLTSFKDFIPGEEQEVLDMCLSDSFEEGDDNILDFLSTFKCYKLPSKENIKNIIYELAHQELIQKPRYVLNCWSPILGSLQSDSAFQNLDGLKQMYQTKAPSAKKIVKLLNADPSEDCERQSLDHLKRFIKSLEGKALSRFIHFCTGSDTMTCSSIDVTFTSLTGFERRPIARTCGPKLELPSTYESYLALAEEFSYIMRDENAWAFDIV